jgi:hypothetical protein
MAELLQPDEIFFTSFEPKVQNRFMMYIDGIPTFLVKMANRPSLNLNTITLDHINIKRKLKGKAEWNDIEIQLYDAVVPSAAQASMEWIRLSHESVTGRDGYADFYKKNITLNLLGPVGDKVEEWTLYGAFVSQFNGGQLDWSSQDPVMITLTLSYDYAVLQY